MESIPPHLLRALADDYRLTARDLCAFQLRCWPSFTISQQMDLNACQNSLLTRAQDLDQRNTSPFFANAAQIAQTALTATARGRHTLTTTTDAVLGLNIGAILVALAAGISRASQTNIDIALRELNELIRLAE
jgi:hypothetical protein